MTSTLTVSERQIGLLLSILLALMGLAMAAVARHGVEHGAPADLVCYAEDPRQAGGPGRPDLVILGGRAYR